MTDEDGLDDVDRGILGELQQDGRRPFREVARRVGVSERTVRARVRRMQDAKLLRVLAFVDPFQLGHSVLALVFLRVEAAAHDRVVAALSAWPEVSYVSTLIGRFDLYVQVVCADNEGLWRLVTQLRDLDGVVETETSIETKVHKFAYAYPGLGS